MSICRSNSLEGAEALLSSAQYGVLALTDPEGNPYAVPLNFCYEQEDHHFFFHCARSGKKLDCIRHNPTVCLHVMGPYRIIAEQYITHYQSLLVYGTATIVADAVKKRDMLKKLCQKFAPNGPREQEVIEKYLPAVTLVDVSISRITQKQNHDD